MIGTRLLVVALSAAWCVPANVLQADQLFWHDVRLDTQGKLLSWVDSDAPYGSIIRNDWEMFEKIPVQPDGYRTYFTYPEFNGLNDPAQPLFSGRFWVHNPAGLFAMLTDSAILYYAYSGDKIVTDRVREMLDHMIAFGTTDATDSWALVPYSSSEAGNPVYRGGTDTLYEEDHAPRGRGDGVGFLEPDKVGELGCAYLQFYEFTLDEKYLQAAIHCADALAAHVRPGDQSHSPWPFRVDARTGTRIREEYTANTIGPIRLFDELLRLGRGRQKSYARARAVAWHWLMTYPIQNQVWTQYFEDVLIYPDYQTNRNQYSALETARYLLQHPEKDPDALLHAKRLLDWVTGFFATDSVTMGGLREKGLQWGAEVLSEQVNDMDKMSSHTARYASVRALWYEVTGDLDSKERAFRSFNWASYASRQDGVVQISIDKGGGFWFSDGYGDNMRHFQRGMASVPEWAPPRESHLLGSTSVVRSIRYGAPAIDYLTFDKAAREVLRLEAPPSSVRAGGKSLPRVNSLNDRPEGYTEEPIASGGFAVRIKHAHSGQIEIQFTIAHATQP
ncbi:MAG TPA: hypothetical protein VMR33_11745 [Candidatus Baltobacteraceae bacterium]|jgi:hypothetical protein|nr:hypothetical protein [Candidatus Baltobacteraceae bacterium]